MGNKYTSQHHAIADKWEQISKDALEKVEKAETKFNNRAIFIGGVSLILGNAIKSYEPTNVGWTIFAGGAMLSLLTAHRQAFQDEHFYKAFSKHALNEREKIYKGKGEILEISPTFDVEEHNFRETQYTPPKPWKAYKTFRTAVIAAGVSSSLAVATAFNQNVKNCLFTCRQEDFQTEVSEWSNLAPMVSPRPMPNPRY